MSEMVMSKYQLTKTPAFPSKCLGCNKDADGVKDFVDLAASVGYYGEDAGPDTPVDYFGATALCEDCAKEIATSCLGLVDISQVAELVEKLNLAEQFIASQVEKNRSLERLINVYAMAHWSPDDSSSASPSDPREEPDDKKSGEGQEGTPGNKSGLFK